MKHLCPFLLRPFYIAASPKSETPLGTVHYRLDRRSIRVAVLLGVITVLNLVDLFCTLFARHQGMLSELNPIAARLFHLNLEPSVICFKLATLLSGTAILWRYRRNPWVSAACWLVFLVYAAIALRWFIWAQDYNQLLQLEAQAKLPIIRLASDF